MASFYEEKQYHRQKELNSKRGANHFDDREYKKSGNKKSRLVDDERDDFYPDSGSRSAFQRTETQSLQPAISMLSDDGAIEYQTMMTEPYENEINNMFSATTIETPIADSADIAEWITPTNEELLITPLDQRHKDYDLMINKCRQAQPEIDQSILADFKQALNHLSLLQLYEMLQSCLQLPFSIRGEDGHLTPAASKFMHDFRLTEEQLIRTNNICQKILYRSSYGVLFLQGNQIFAKLTQNKNKSRSAIKGYSILKPDGTWEHPWETSVRMVKQEVQYRNSEEEEWRSFDIDEHVQEDERKIFLECLVNGKDAASYRHIGLFIIRLKPNMQIRVNDSREADINGNWYPMGSLKSNIYTLSPFLKYLQQYPRLI